VTRDRNAFVALSGVIAPRAATAANSRRRKLPENVAELLHLIIGHAAVHFERREAIAEHCAHGRSCHWGTRDHVGDGREQRGWKAAANVTNAASVDTYSE
jgi:hypothetical protein